MQPMLPPTLPHRWTDLEQTLSEDFKKIREQAMILIQRLLKLKIKLEGEGVSYLHNIHIYPQSYSPVALATRSYIKQYHGKSSKSMYN